MFQRLKKWLLFKLCNDTVQEHLSNAVDSHLLEISRQASDYENKLTEQRRIIQRQEDLLANKNGKATIAQQLYVTDHAVHQYRKRVGFGGSDDELRKMIYKLTIRHLHSMDRLQDGHYKISDKAAVRVKDNTVCTIVHPTKRQS